MAIHPIRVVGDPVLSSPTRPVKDFDDELRTLIADMYEKMDEWQSKPGAPSAGFDAETFRFIQEIGRRRQES